MQKSTLTALLGLVLLISAAFVAVLKSQDQPEVSKGNSTPAAKVAEKTKSSKEKTAVEKPIKIEFGLNASFGPKPQ